jgi:hypothetical protein
VSGKTKEFDEGYEAFDADLDASANPYEPSDDRCLSWNDGYMQAQDEYNKEFL